MDHKQKNDKADRPAGLGGETRELSDRKMAHVPWSDFVGVILTLIRLSVEVRRMSGRIILSSQSAARIAICCFGQSANRLKNPPGGCCLKMADPLR